jgi:hypothetical protein
MIVALTAVATALVQTPSSGRVEFTPARPVMTVGDTLRLSAKAFDAAGQPISRPVVQWFTATFEFQGTIDSTGLVRAGAAGQIVVSALVRSADGGRPVVGTLAIPIQPPPASRIEIAPAVRSLLAGQSISLRATPIAATGDPRRDTVSWSSSNPAVLRVGPTGRVTAVAPGRVVVTARAGRAETSLPIVVGANNIATLTITPASSSVRTGDVVRLEALANDRKGATVANPVTEWAITPGTGEIDGDGAFVAEQPGSYRVVATSGNLVATATVEVRSREATRPAKVVGRVPIGMLATEFWLHPDGKHGYLGTVGFGGPGGDRLYAIDLTDPADPKIIDSVVVDAREINDVMTTEDGRWGVISRENSSTRKNGITVLDLSDPGHPKAVADYNATVSGGVHSVFVSKGYVYLTDDATGSMRVISLADPLRPKEVARWQSSPGENTGRMLHDIDVRDGLAYLSYWNDGLIILDVGNGIKGGSPERPALVSQLKYDLDALYRDVEIAGGPGYIRGTHTAWRHKNYVFVGDEVFAAKPIGGPGPLGRAWGRLHVVDVSDVTRPKIVAHYEPKDGGVHNVYVAGDTLYLGDYQGGLRVLDISGELRGDLLRQGREVAHVMTGDAKGFLPNTAMAWGAIYRNGYIYVPDMHSGLWVVQLETKRELTP